MTDETLPPFSTRNRGSRNQIVNDFPEKARMGLLHILVDLEKRKYIESWPAVVSELQRIARLAPGFKGDTSWVSDTQEILLQLDWDKVFDFCERLYGHLPQAVAVYDKEFGESREVTSRSEVQKYIAGELQRLFLEDNLAFEFSDGLVRRRGRRHTADQVAKAELVLGDPRLANARAHYNKALRFFRAVSEPDYENTVKEAVCAVEATARVLFPSAGKTLDDIRKSITGNKPGELPHPISKTFEGLYVFRGGGQGVSHGGATGGPATKELAEYTLAVAASQIVLLVDLSAASEPEVPF